MASSSKEPRGQKVALVTGASDGIGFETARELAKRGFRVLMHGRSQEKLDRCASILEKDLGLDPGSGVFETLVADFADLSQVRSFGKALAARLPDLAVLVHNAGVYAKNLVLSPDGWEKTWQINFLAPVILNEALMHRLYAFGESGEPARLIWVSSMVHAQGNLDWNDLNHKNSWSAYQAYADSKLAVTLFAFKLARMVEAERIGVFALHPGVVSTKLLRDGFGMAHGLSQSQGARTSVFLATDPSLKGRSGEYWSELKPAKASRLALDEELQDRLYNWAMAALALH